MVFQAHGQIVRIADRHPRIEAAVEGGLRLAVGKLHYDVVKLDGLSVAVEEVIHGGEDRRGSAGSACTIAV